MDTDRHGTRGLGARLLAISFAASAILGCDRPSPEEIQAGNDRWNRIMGGQFDANGNLFRELPEVAPKLGWAGAPRIAMLVPKQHIGSLPSPSQRMDIFFIELNELSNREPLPIAQEVVDSARMYSIRGLLTGKVSDSELRAISEYQERRRKTKSVTLSWDRTPPDSYATWLKKKLMVVRPKTSLIIEFDSSNPYVSDGAVAGLRRYSKMHCFRAEDIRPDPKSVYDMRWKFARAFLLQKQADDPSPENCALNRWNSILISEESDRSEDWISIDCEPVLQSCSIEFVVLGRMARTEVSALDVDLWRAHVDAMREIINGFVLDEQTNYFRSRCAGTTRSPVSQSPCSIVMMPAERDRHLRQAESRF